MQLSVRAAALRTALERATHETATVEETATGWRISAPVALDRTIADFQAALTAVRTGDDWGSGADAGRLTVWTEIRGDA
jgi:hypothetical protein